MVGFIRDFGVFVSTELNGDTINGSREEGKRGDGGQRSQQSETGSKDNHDDDEKSRRKWA
jgi:hypothetical protein